MIRLKLASYNIHAAVGTDGHFDPFRIAEVVREVDADIIALQEVEHHRVNDLDLLDFLAQQTNMTALAGPTMLRESRDYGNAILSRLPIVSHRLIDLSLEPHEPRGALQVQFDYQGHRLLVYATHLGLKPVERRHQVKNILAEFEQQQADTTVLMGDLNEWFLWGRPLRWLHRYFDTTPACRSFPSTWPVLTLDRIWVQPRRHLIAVAAHRSALARKASDHLPVTALVELD
ncbi:endonuclease/exonuclease/phosphatase family protein [Methylophaga sp.]|uniref:endonuclease/exonuclease/phosphatase family protein n=1 Tax=Methylophaga sp. TaxID=2024840 RepID=UPI0025DCF86B|nr:endonuclease/exonuclease/phosphatase family protein [Methylophaga sp.]